MNSVNSEILVASVGNVAVLIYDGNLKTWNDAGLMDGVLPEEGLIPALVFLLTDPVYSNARIVARRQTVKQEVVINCYVGPGLQFKRPTPRFFEWRDARSSCIFGLNFFSEADADHFIGNMQKVISKVGKSKKAEQRLSPCGSLESVKCSKLDTLPLPGKILHPNKATSAKRDSYDPAQNSPCYNISPNPEVQSRPLPPLPPNEGSSSVPTLRQNSLSKQPKKVPPPPLLGKNEQAKAIISLSRPKTLLPPLLSPSHLAEAPSLCMGGIPPPPPPPPQTAPPSNLSCSNAFNPPGRTKRSQSVGLLDAISTVQLKKIELLQTPGEGSSLKEGNYVDMMSEIADKIRRRKEKKNNENQADTPGLNKSSSPYAATEFKSNSRPQSGKSSKIPPPSNLPGRPLKRIQHAESFTCGQNTLPSVAEINTGQGHELLNDKIDSLRRGFEKLKTDINERLDQFKDDVISAIKTEFSRH